jgi:SAM-dependent methyltransferase
MSRKDESRLMKLIEHFSAEIAESDAILDVGCCSGFVVSKFRAMGKKAFGIDISIKGNAIPYCHNGDARDISRFGSRRFDLVLCIEVIEHLDAKGQKAALREICRVAKSGATVIFTTPNGHDEHRNPEHLACFGSPSDFHRFLWGYFEEVHIYGSGMSRPAIERALRPLAHKFLRKPVNAIADKFYGTNNFYYDAPAADGCDGMVAVCRKR